MIPPQRILLTGFMGSGKTTVGRLLAEHLGWTFFDLDQQIERRQGRTVAEIFTESGEPHFRALELATLEEITQGQQRVVALGGGAPTQPALRARHATAAGTAIVHLDAPFAVLYERCEQQRRDQGAVRPLFGERADTEERYRQRRPVYAAFAHHTVRADLPSPQAVMESVLAALFPTSKQ